MNIIFHKDSHETYTLECIRLDGSSTTSALDTKSFLKHDLLHYAIESTAGLHGSFFGQIEQGKNLEQMTPKAMRDEPEQMGSEEARITEMLTGMFTGYIKSGVETDEFLVGARTVFAAHDIPVPSFLIVEYAEEVKRVYLMLVSRWENMKTKQSFSVDFPRLLS